MKSTAKKQQTDAYSSNPTTKSTSLKKPKFCVEAGCKTSATSHGYCRLHYLANWKTLRFNDQVKAEQRLNNFIDKIAKKYPQSYMDKIKQGLEDETVFNQTAVELDVEPKENGVETDNEFLERFLRVVKPGE